MKKICIYIPPVKTISGTVFSLLEMGQYLFDNGCFVVFDMQDHIKQLATKRYTFDFNTDYYNVDYDIVITTYKGYLIGKYKNVIILRTTMSQGIDFSRFKYIDDYRFDKSKNHRLEIYTKYWNLKPDVVYNEFFIYRKYDENHICSTFTIQSSNATLYPYLSYKGLIYDSVFDMRPRLPFEFLYMNKPVIYKYKSSGLRKFIDSYKYELYIDMEDLI